MSREVVKCTPSLMATLGTPVSNPGCRSGNEKEGIRVARTKWKQ
jgi:hypothetical protein